MMIAPVVLARSSSIATGRLLEGGWLLILKCPIYFLPPPCGEGWGGGPPVCDILFKTNYLTVERPPPLVPPHKGEGDLGFNFV